jgi:MFS family permease
MANEPTTAEKIRKLPWSIGANATLMVFIQLTFFGSVFVLFLGALELDKTQIGFILSLISFSNVIALFIAPSVARIGYKRTYLTFFGIRSGITALLLLIPWVLFSFGNQAALIFITGVVALFAICRSIGVTALFPWVQEYVPNSVRGKYSATNNLFVGLTGFVTVTLAGFMLEQTTGLSGFMILITIGVLFGFISVWAASHIPGGAPAKVGKAVGTMFHDLVAATRDKSLLLYLFGAGCLTLAIVPLNSFVPLFMQEQVGLSSGNVVLIQTGVLLGGLLSTYLWGWTADRYGSRPIMLSGASLRVLLPVLWMLMPRNDVTSLYAALGIALLQGIADMAWVIGSTRLLYVSVVPAEKKTGYMALYSAWVGIVSGVSQLLGGQIVQHSTGVSGQFLIFAFDPYTGLFILGFILPVAGILLLRKVRADTEVKVEEFASLFLRGNPILAMTSLVEYHLWAKDEQAVVHITERLGQTRSPLTVEELLEALADQWY